MSSFNQMQIMNTTISMVNNIETMKKIGFKEMNAEFADTKGSVNYRPEGVCRLFHPEIFGGKAMIIDVVFPANNPNNYGYFSYIEDTHFTITENDKGMNYINCRLVKGVQPEFAPNIVFEKES